MYRYTYPIIGSNSNLPFYLTGIGIADPEYHVNRMDGLISHQILFVDSGEGILKVDGKQFDLKRGSLFYLSPKIPHEYYSENGSLKTCWIVFRGGCLAEIMAGLGFEDYNVVQTQCLNFISSQFNAIFASAEAADSGGEKCSILLYEYILAVRNIFRHTAENGNINRITEPVLAFINEHYREDITLEQLAEVSGVSMQHFCRLFKARTDLRPLEYIAKLRISHAKRLLEGTDLSIADISQGIGYQSNTYFGMVFRKYEGMSPSEYRRNKCRIPK